MSKTLDSHRLYSHFLDALNAGTSPNEVADVCAEALNRAKTSYEAEQRNIKQRKKEAAVDSLLSSLQNCGTAFEIPELAAGDSTAAKDELINLMNNLRDILPLAPKEKETAILKNFISSL